MTLTVPPPVLSQEDVTGLRFAAKKPIALTCGPVTFPEGTVLTPENAVQFGFLLYRQEGGGAIQVWDEAGKAWLAEAAAPALQSLFYKDDQWQSILVAVGQKDAADQDKFSTDSTSGLPKYFVRCFFAGKDAQGEEHTGTSPDSQAVEVLAFGEEDRAGLAIEPEKPDQATRIRLFLKDASLAERGRITIEQAVGGFQIELVVDGTTLVLATNGEIVLTPRAGQAVRVQGDLLVQGDVQVNGVTLHVP